MNTQINITENGTTTLATAGKYCDRNIDVNVEVAGAAVNDADEILDGSFSGEYASDKLTSLKTRAFENMTNITSISLPNCTTIDGERTFARMTGLKSLYLPKLTTITGGAEVFARINITELDLPNLTTVTNFYCIFYVMEYVERINLPKLGGTTIKASSFSTCRNLNTVILGGSELNPLDNTNAFVNTNIQRGTGYIYVPDALVDSYKSATNWVAFADQIKPISELEE